MKLHIAKIIGYAYFLTNVNATVRSKIYVRLTDLVIYGRFHINFWPKIEVF